MDSQKNQSLLRQGNILFDKGQFSKALKIFKKLYECNDIDLKEKSFELVTKCFEIMEEWKGFAAWLERLEVDNLSQCVNRITNNNYFQFGFIQPAKVVLKKVCSHNPTLKRILIDLCTFLQKMGRTKEACRLNLHLLDLFPNQRDHYLRQARCLSSMGRFHEAFNILRKATSSQLDKSKALLYVQQGKTHALVDEYNQAFEALIIASQTDAYEEKIYFQVAKLLSSSQINSEGSQNTFRCFLFASNPNQIQCQMLMKIQLSKIRQKGYPIEYPRSILGLGTEWSYQIIILSKRLWQFQNVREYFRNNEIYSWHFNKKKAKIMSLLAACYQILHDYGQAFKCYSILYQEDKYMLNFRWQISCALNLARMGRRQEALIRLKRIESNAQTLYKARFKDQDKVCELYYLLGMQQKCIEFSSQRQKVSCFQAIFWQLKSSFALRYDQKASHKFRNFCNRQYRLFDPRQFISEQFIELIRWGGRHGLGGEARILLSAMDKIINAQKYICYGSNYLDKMHVKLKAAKIEIDGPFEPRKYFY